MKIINTFFLTYLIWILSATYMLGQEITMFPGFWGSQYYEGKNRISSQEVELKMKKNTYSHKEWTKSKNQNLGSWLCLGGQFGFLIWQINNEKNGKSGTPQLVGNLACAGIGIGLVYASQNSKKRAILHYNEKYRQPETSYIKLGLSGNGVGLTATF